MNKTEIMNQGINYIRDPRIKNAAMVLTEKLPDYFFRIAASSTGKYHPAYSLGEGGLVRHTLAAMKIANELLYNNDTYAFKPLEKDLILLSILVHDGFKLGKEESKYTKFDHPLLSAMFVEENKDEAKLSDLEVELIKQAVSSHMGQWNTNMYEKTELPTPKSGVSKFVHICDFLASRKFLHVDLDN